MTILKEHEGMDYLTKGGYVATIDRVRPDDYTDTRVSVSCWSRGNATTLNHYGRSSGFEEMDFVRFVNKVDDPEEYV